MARERRRQPRLWARRARQQAPGQTTHQLLHRHQLPRLLVFGKDDVAEAACAAGTRCRQRQRRERERARALLPAPRVHVRARSQLPAVQRSLGLFRHHISGAPRPAEAAAANRTWCLSTPPNTTHRGPGPGSMCISLWKSCWYAGAQAVRGAGSGRLIPRWHHAGPQGGGSTLCKTLFRSSAARGSEAKSRRRAGGGRGAGCRPRRGVRR